jgi:hypothetical protein
MRKIILRFIDLIGIAAGVENVRQHLNSNKKLLIEIKKSHNEAAIFLLFEN